MFKMWFINVKDTVQEETMKKIILIAAASAFLCGCTWTRPHLIVASNTPISGSYKIIGPASGESCETHLFGLFNMGTRSRLQAAIDEALEKSKGDALIEITTDVTYSNYLLADTSCILVNAVVGKNWTEF